MNWQTIDSAPEHWDFYLVCMPDGYICILQYQPFDGGRDGKKANSWYDEDDCRQEPTHWMPLPEPPTDRRTPEVE